jgi:hypothetical protein
LKKFFRNQPELTEENKTQSFSLWYLFLGFGRIVGSEIIGFSGYILLISDWVLIALLIIVPSIYLFWNGIAQIYTGIKFLFSPSKSN